MLKKKYRPWFKAFSGLSTNISAAWLASIFIGPTVTFPQKPEDFFSLTLSTILGIVFLLLTVWFERKLEK